MRAMIFACMLALVGCNHHRGDMEEDCNKDGTCNSPNLKCNGLGQCTAKQREDVITPGVCRYESECFCTTCADKCGDAGIKECAFSDTSVWGSKPSVCECK